MRLKISKAMGKVAIIFGDSNGLFSTAGRSIQGTDEGVFKANGSFNLTGDEWIWDGDNQVAILVGRDTVGIMSSPVHLVMIDLAENDGRQS